MSYLSKLHARLMPGGIPLAWRQLTADKKRFSTALAGVSFGVVLMIFQLGIFEAFMVMVVRPIEAMRGEIAIISRSYQYIMSPGIFPERRLHQAYATPGVDRVYPVRLDFLQWRNPDDGRISDLACFGVHPGRNPFTIPEIASRADVLSSPDGILFDSLSSPDLGNVSRLFAKDGEVHSEINRQRVIVRGLFRIGQTLAAYGNAVMGLETYMRVSRHDGGMVQLGMITLKPDADAASVIAGLRKIIPDDAKVVTRAELIGIEQVYWQTNTPIGFIVTAGMVIAMLVGAIIVYQILYTDINDHQKEYATLKAIGLGNDFFVRFIISESLILLVLGFIPGMFIAALLFKLAETQAGLPTRLTLFGTLTVFGLSAVMCVVAGLFATRRLRAADPADVF